MKRILKSLARLYPAAWRRRYGAEYEALLEDRTPRARDAFDVLWGAVTVHVTSKSFVRIVLPCALAGGLAALALSFKVPPLYTSRNEFTRVTRYIPEDGPRPPSETVVVSVRNPPSSYVGPYGDLIRAINYPDALTFGGGHSITGGRSITIDGHVAPFNDSIQFVFNHYYLAKLIQKYELYPRERARMPLDKLIPRMQSAITVRYTSRLTSFRFSRMWNRPTDSAQKLEQNFAVQFTYPDALVAQKVDQELAWLLDADVMRHTGGLQGTLHTTHDRAFTDSYMRDLDFQGLPASLPQRPNGLSRSAECGIGLLDGLFCGLVLATFRGPRQDTSVSS